MTLIDTLPANLKNIKDKFLSAVNVGDEIWMIPYHADCVMVYSKSSGTFTTYHNWPAEYLVNTQVSPPQFASSVYDGQYIWMIPRELKTSASGAGSIVKINTRGKKKGVMSIYTNWSLSIKNESFTIYASSIIHKQVTLMSIQGLIKIDYKELNPTQAYLDTTLTHVISKKLTVWLLEKTDKYFDTSYVSVLNQGEYVYEIPSGDRNLIKLNMSSLNSIQFLNWPTEYNKNRTGFTTAVFDGESIWMFSKGQSIVRFNTKAETMTEYNNWPAGFTKQPYSFYSSVFDGKDIWLIPDDASQMIKISTSTDNSPDDDGSTGGGSGGGGIPPPPPALTIVKLNQAQMVNLSTDQQIGNVIESVLNSTGTLLEITNIAADKDITLRVEAISSGIPLTVKLDGTLLQALWQRNALLEVTNGKQLYQIPTKQINLDTLMQQVESDSVMKDIQATISISDSSASSLSLFQTQASLQNATIVTNPQQFKIAFTYRGKELTSEVALPYRYVTKLLAISGPASQYTTAVTLDPNGNLQHVPTSVNFLGAKTYLAAKDMRLGGEYAWISYSKTFTDIASHWAKASINQGGQRLIIKGVGNNNFEPNRPVTRAEFATLLVRSFGLPLHASPKTFPDVTSRDWFNPYVQTVAFYSLINGYSDGTFKPNGYITRQEAIVMLARLMRMIGYASVVSENPGTLATYVDRNKVSTWAVADAELNIKAKTIQGDNLNKVRPLDPLTRAEVATIVLRLLRNAGLITLIE